MSHKGWSCGEKNRPPLESPHYVLDALGTHKDQSRLRTRWRNDLDSFIKRWHRVAQNVNQWRSMWRAYVQPKTFNGRNWAELSHKIIDDQAQCARCFHTWLVIIGLEQVLEKRLENVAQNQISNARSIGKNHGPAKIFSFADPALKPGCEKNVLVRSKHPLSLFTFWKWRLHLNHD